jgi:RNA polymerase sigma-70 factor (ECF subfamily)
VGHPQTVTVLLQGVRNGDQDSLSRLIPLVYSNLRQMADRCLRRERPDHTLEPNALVHELYLRLVDQSQPGYQNRAHFFAVAANLMRQILVDHARGRAAAKRGGGAVKLPLEDDIACSAERASMIVAMDDSLKALADFDPDKARLVELKYFGGLTAEESAEVLGLPVSVVRRDLRIAQAWLRREMEPRHSDQQREMAKAAGAGA